MPGEIPNQEDFDEDVAGSVALKRSSALSLADYFPKPAPTSLLWPGQHFRGTQRVTPSGLHGINEDWSVNVTIVSCKYESGTLSGIMEAENVPHTKFPVKTFWEGEIIDNANHVFFTGKWEAWPDTDLVHWSKFSSFEQIKGAVQKQSGRCDALCGYPVIYMRWKEKFFVNCSHECGLTIAGARCPPPLSLSSFCRLSRQLQEGVRGDDAPARWIQRLSRPPGSGPEPQSPSDSGRPQTHTRLSVPAALSGLLRAPELCILPCSPLSPPANPSLLSGVPRCELCL
uniref:Glucose-induced degradation protein 4 n=1 Tax=Tetraselmis sp. GSL018 TaxID=582737 RepID=A0A061R4S4_9CHLO